MEICGKSQRQAQVLPEDLASVLKSPPRPLSRVNGWSPPLHSFQVICWTMFLLMAFANFGIFIPLLPCDWKKVAYAVTGTVFLFHMLVHLAAVSIDPAEDNVRMKNYSKPMPIFDRSKHPHVIQNQYCHLCEVTVSKKAKHCSSCNKCVSGFDHHCKWLNNCVGSRNYWFFFSSVASALAGLLCMMGLLLYIVIQYYTNPSRLRTHPLYKDVRSKSTWLLFLPLWPVQVETPVVLSIAAVVLLLSIANFVLLGHLLAFHFFLMVKHLSTYEYMMQARFQSPEPVRRKDPFLKRQLGHPQEKEDSLTSLSSAWGLKHKEFLPSSIYPSLSSINTMPPGSASPPRAVKKQTQEPRWPASQDSVEESAAGVAVPARGRAFPLDPSCPLRILAKESTVQGLLARPSLCSSSESLRLQNALSSPPSMGSLARPEEERPEEGRAQDGQGQAVAEEAPSAGLLSSQEAAHPPAAQHQVT